MKATLPGEMSGPQAVAKLPTPLVHGGLVVGVLAVSTSAILIRIADAPPLAVAFWRCALGAAALAPFALRARRGAVRLERGQVGQLAASGAFLAVHFALWISSLDYTTVASSVLLVTMAALLVPVGSALLLAEPPSRRTMVGVAAAAIGAAIVALSGGGASASAPAPLLGNGLALGGAVAVTGYLLVGRAARQRLPVTVYAAAVYGVAALLLLPVCLVAGADLVGYDARTWAAIAALVAGPQLLGHTVFNALLSTVNATVVAVTVLAEPIGAALLAAIILAELPPVGFYAGAPLVLAGVFLAVTRGRRVPPAPT